MLIIVNINWMQRQTRLEEGSVPHFFCQQWSYFMKSRHAVAWSAGTLVSCLLLAGCSSAPSPQSLSSAGLPSTAAAGPAAAPSTTAKATSSGAVSACSLVTEADATAALGADPGPGAGPTQSPTSGCTFGVSPSMVSIHLSPAGKAEYDQMRAGPVQGAMIGDLAGIGHGAFGAFTAPFASIASYHASAYVSIVIVADGSQDRAIILAEAADARL